MQGTYEGISSRPLCPFFIGIMMSGSKANRSHRIIDLSVPERVSRGRNSTRKPSIHLQKKKKKTGA
jgi:hypothetical protein